MIRSLTLVGPIVKEFNDVGFVERLEGVLEGFEMVVSCFRGPTDRVLKIVEEFFFQSGLLRELERVSSRRASALEQAITMAPGTT